MGEGGDAPKARQQAAARALTRSREELALRVVGRAAAGQAVLLAGVSGIGRTKVLRRITQLHAGPVIAGGGLAGLRSVPNMALSRALRLPVPSSDPTRAAEFVVAAAGRCTLLALDDLHLCDPLTLEVAALLVGQLPVVMTVADDTSRGAQILAAFLPLPGVVVEPVLPLAEAEAGELVRSAYRGADPTALRSILHSAGGIPTALMAMAADPGASDLRAAVAHRLSALTPHARTALCLLGLLGRPVDPAVLGPELADAAIGSGVAVDNDGRIEARTKLDVEVALSVLPVEQRRSLHAALGRRLPDAGERARHLEAAGDTAAANAAALEAAEAATSEWERTRHLAIAARTTAQQERAQACLDVGMAASSSGDHRLAADLVTTAGADADPRGALIHARAAAAIGDHTTALAHLDRIAGIATSDDISLAAALERARALCVRDPIAAMDVATEAHSRALSDEERARAAGLLGAAQLAAQAEGWEATLESAAALATACGLHDVAYAATLNRCSGLLRTSRPDETEVLARNAEAETARAGLAQWSNRFTAVRLWVQVHARARLSVAMATGEALLDAPLPPALRREVMAQVGLAYGDSGQLAAARSIVDSAEAQGGDLLAWSGAELEALGGDRVRAAELATAVLAAADGWPVPEWAAVTAAWAGVQSSLASVTAPASSGAGAELEALAAVDHRSQAAELFIWAARRWAGLSRRSELRCRLAAAVATADSEPQAARTELRTLAKDLEAEELVLLARQVTRARRQLGDDEVPAVATGARGGMLSRREAEVMAGVAEGLTSVVIAHRLGVAPSTVETQVKSAMHKLGATTRTEAAVLAAQ